MAEAALPPDTLPELTEAEEGEPEVPVGALPPSPAAAAEPLPETAPTVLSAAETAKLRRQRKQEEEQAQQHVHKQVCLQRKSVSRGRKRGSAKAAPAEEPGGPAAQGSLSETAAEVQGLLPAAKRCKSSGSRVAAAARPALPKQRPSPALRCRSVWVAPATESAAVDQMEQQRQEEQAPESMQEGAAGRAAADTASPASPPGAPEMAELAAAHWQVAELLHSPALAGVLGAEDATPADAQPGNKGAAAVEAAAAAAGKPPGMLAAAAEASAVASELDAPSCLAELLQAEVVDLPGPSLLGVSQPLRPPGDAVNAIAAQPEQVPTLAAAAEKASRPPMPAEPAEQQPAAKKQRLQRGGPTAEADANATPPGEAGCTQVMKRLTPVSGGGTGPRHRKGRLLGMLAGVSKSAGTSGRSKVRGPRGQYSPPTRLPVWGRLPCSCTRFLPPALTDGHRIPSIAQSGGRSLGKARRGGDEVVQRPRSTPGSGGATTDICSPADRRLSNASNGAAALAAAKASAALGNGSPYSGAFDFPAPEAAAVPADEGYGSVGEDEGEAAASAAHGCRQPKKAAANATQQEQQQQRGIIEMAQGPPVEAAAVPAEAEHAPGSPARPSQQQQQQDAALAQQTQPTLPEQQQQQQDSVQATAVEESLQQLSPDVAGPVGAATAGPPSAAPTPQSQQQRLSPAQAKQQRQRRPLVGTTRCASRLVHPLPALSGASGAPTLPPLHRPHARALLLPAPLPDS